MRVVLAVLALFGASSVADRAAADPYRWCVEYASRGATNCYFMTLQQCQAAAAGNGSFCRPNTFYDGRPVTTPGETVRRNRKRS